MNYLSIIGFGPVKQANLELKSINLLIGEQSIGKSTIAKLIAIFTDNSSLASIASGGIKAWKSRLSMYDLGVYSENSYHVYYDFKDNGVDLSISISNKRVVTKLIVSGKQITNKTEIGRSIIGIRMRTIAHREAFLESLLKEVSSLSDKKADSKYSLLSLYSLMESSLYVPAERVIYSLFNNLRSAFALMNESVSSTFLRFMVSFDKAISRLKEYDSKLLKIKYINEEMGQSFIDYSSKKKYPLINASSGIQSTIPLLLVLEDIKNREYSSIVIEEPETNLFPNTQVALLNLIMLKAREGDRIVTITTHSPYILSALNNYLYAGSLSKEVKKNAIKMIDEIVPSSLRLNTNECSVYSIGESINTDRAYCSSLIDKETGMIDTNSLDRISFHMSDVFESLQEVYLKSME